MDSLREKESGNSDSWKQEKGDGVATRDASDTAQSRHEANTREEANNIRVPCSHGYSSSAVSRRGSWTGRRTISWRAAPGAIMG